MHDISKALGSLEELAREEAASVALCLHDACLRLRTSAPPAQVLVRASVCGARLESHRRPSCARADERTAGRGTV